MEPDRIAGLVLTASVFPWTRGAWPHPLVLGAFAAYDVDGLGERIVARRRRIVSPEAFVAWGFRMLTVDPATIPPEVVQLQVELVRDTRDDAEQPATFVQAARSIT